jgi:DNA-binding response OmpR family regulator
MLIAVTGWGQQEDRKATSAAGFDIHLVKPANATEIMRIIRAKHSNNQQNNPNLSR